MRNSPVVPHADVALHPHKARLEVESPSINEAQSLTEKSVCRPQVEVCIIGRELPNRLRLNLGKRQRQVVIDRCRS